MYLLCSGIINQLIMLLLLTLHSSSHLTVMLYSSIVKKTVVWYKEGSAGDCYFSTDS